MEYPDGRRSCAICNATAVKSVDDARDNMAATIRFLEAELNMKSTIPFDFALVDNVQMAHLNKREATNKVKELGAYITRGANTPAR